MPEETKQAASLEVYCMYCNRELTEDDDIHFTAGPYGFDFDVVCGECMDRVKKAQAEGAMGIGGGVGPGDLGMGEELGMGMGLGQGDFFDAMMGGELGETPEG